jgi:hypothetical protein
VNNEKVLKRCGERKEEEKRNMIKVEDCTEILRRCEGN